MITGFNTDVRHREVVLHVQTEDKGESNPCIETLVYVGGQILGRRRAGYRELLTSGKGADAVIKLMESQHRSMIQEIRRGGLDERLAAIGALEIDETAEEEPETVSAEPQAGDDGGPPPDAAAGPSLDQVILDYLSAEAEQEHLVLVMDAAGDLLPGGSARLSFQARTSRADEPVPEAAISVKMISTSSEPVALAKGETDDQGLLELQVTLPALDSGAAALIVHATSSVGTAELKHLI